MGEKGSWHILHITKQLFHVFESECVCEKFCRSCLKLELGYPCEKCVRMCINKMF